MKMYVSYFCFLFLFCFCFCFYFYFYFCFYFCFVFIFVLFFFICFSLFLTTSSFRVWVAIQTELPSDIICAGLNCFVHVVMYAYFAYPVGFLRSSITSLQLAQFVAAGGTVVYAFYMRTMTVRLFFFFVFFFPPFFFLSFLFFFVFFQFSFFVLLVTHLSLQENPCRGTYAAELHGIVMYIIYFALFTNFFVQQYLRFFFFLFIFASVFHLLFSFSFVIFFLTISPLTARRRPGLPRRLLPRRPNKLPKKSKKKTKNKNKTKKQKHKRYQNDFICEKKIKLKKKTQKQKNHQHKKHKKHNKLTRRSFFGSRRKAEGGNKTGRWRKKKKKGKIFPF